MKWSSWSSRIHWHHGKSHFLPFLLEEMFKSVDILCVPASLDAAFDAEVRYPTKQIDQTFSDYLGWMMPASTVTMFLGLLFNGSTFSVQNVQIEVASSKVLVSSFSAALWLQGKGARVVGLLDTNEEPWDARSEWKQFIFIYLLKSKTTLRPSWCEFFEEQKSMLKYADNCVSVQNMDLP